MASEEANIEYNWLKRLHKPEAQTILLLKEHYHKIKDMP